MNYNHIPKVPSQLIITSERRLIIAYYLQQSIITINTFSYIAFMNRKVGHIERNICNILYFLYQCFSVYRSSSSWSSFWFGCNLWVCMSYISEIPSSILKETGNQCSSGLSKKYQCINLHWTTTVGKYMQYLVLIG